MRILLIEDDLDDIELLQEALKSGGVSYEMEIIHDGSDALNYLRDNGEGPDIIILDLNLPKVHGREVILEIKSIPAFKHIPLLILSTSSSKEDMDYAYKNGATKYLVKPSNVQQINETVNAIVSMYNENAVPGKPRK
ncbi:MAG TPA: response regulator [Ferruginibacter sp.]|nr:response regulator [Ferruginibacter sp.]